MGLCYANPPFCQVAKALTKIALEAARVILCTTTDWVTTGEQEKVLKEFFQLFVVPLLLLAAGVRFLLLFFMKKMFCF